MPSYLSSIQCSKEELLDVKAIITSGIIHPTSRRRIPEDRRLLE